MEPGEPAVPPQAALCPPVYIFGTTPKGQDGKEYRQEIENERSKRHWLSLMNTGLELAEEQLRTGRRRVNLKEVALNLVRDVHGNGGQFIRKDYDESSPTKRRETVLDALSATKSLAELIKKFRHRRNQRNDIDADANQRNDIDADANQRNDIDADANQRNDIDADANQRNNVAVARLDNIDTDTEPVELARFDDIDMDDELVEFADADLVEFHTFWSPSTSPDTVLALGLGDESFGSP